MATVQLRRYELMPGVIDDFVDWFPRILPARAAYGFTVRFAFADREKNEFVWAVSHDGDRAEFEAAVERYNASPERSAAFEGQPRRVGAMHLSFVNDVLVG